jgi:hypothetical protein
MELPFFFEKKRNNKKKPDLMHQITILLPDTWIFTFNMLGFMLIHGSHSSMLFVYLVYAN